VLPNIKKQCINIGGTINRATKFSKKKFFTKQEKKCDDRWTTFTPGGDRLLTFQAKAFDTYADFQKMRNGVCSIRYVIDKKMFVRRLYKLRSAQRYLH